MNRFAILAGERIFLMRNVCADLDNWIAVLEYHQLGDLDLFFVFLPFIDRDLAGANDNGGALFWRTGVVKITCVVFYKFHVLGLKKGGELKAWPFTSGFLSFSDCVSFSL